MSDDEDLYDDLPDLNFGESVCKIDEEREYFKKQLDEKEADLHKTKERIAHLEKENKILEKNISSLYQTAVNEIKRKDQLIEELRREKESLIFRRKGRQDHVIKSTDASSRGVDSSFHQVSSLSPKHLLSSEESTISMLSSPVNTVKNKLLGNLCSVEFSSDISFDYKSSTECFSSSLVSNPVQEKKRDSSCKVGNDSENISKTKTKNSKINVSEKTCESKSSEICDSLPSDSSQTSSNISYRSGRNEHTWGTVLSKNEKQSSSEGRRERQKDNYSDKYYSRNSHRSSYNNHRSLKLPNERNRNDRSWDRNNDRKYNSYKEIDFREQKSRTGMCVEMRRKHPVHSRWSPSPPNSRRYSDRRCSNSRVKTLSDNVRAAAQLKSKYSKAMREKSVSRTPVKQQKLFQKKMKLESSCKPVELQSIAFPKVNLENRFVSEEHDYERKLSSKCSVVKSINVDQCDSVQRKENNSEVSDKSCHVYESENTKKEMKRKEETSLEFNLKTGFSEHDSAAQSNKCSGNVYRNESFQKESDVELINNKDNAFEKLPLQQLRTPPSKNLIPLKISPSFEDPAVVEESKFSFCVFNEQCEFKRPKRKRFVKLLVSDIKDFRVSENSEKDYSESNNDNCGVAMKQNMDFFQQGNNGALEQSAFHEKGGLVDFKNETALKHDNGKDHNNSILEENLQETSETISSDIETLNTEKLCEVVVPKSKSTNKKRKLDSICEELKANLEKKRAISLVESVPDGSMNTLHDIDKQINICGTAVKTDESNTVNKISNFSMTVGDTVNSVEPPKPVISKRRRKVCNLQDNVVQVISQVKSSLS